MGRDSSKGKGKTGGRGGGRKMFIANVEELAIRDREVSELQDARNKRRAGSDEESGDDHAAGGDKSDNEEGDNVFAFDRSKNTEKDTSVADLEPKMKGLLSGGSVNPNHAKKPVEKMIKVKNINDAVPDADPEAGFNRKERELIAATKAKEDYQRRHMAGETEQAKADLARLAIIRARREADAKKREAEGRKPGMSATGIESSSDDDSSDDEGGKKGPKVVKAAVPKPAAPVVPLSAAAQASAALQAKKKAAAAAEPEDERAADGGPPKLKAMDIKKLNGDALKEHLKERGLDVQGQKKDLMKRLTDYEAARA